MTFMERINEARTMWTVMMPGVALPPQETFARWVGRFSNEEILYAISKTEAAVRRGGIESPARYCTASMLAAQRDKNPTQQAAGHQ